MRAVFAPHSEIPASQQLPVEVSPGAVIRPVVRPRRGRRLLARCRVSHWAQWHVDYDNPGSALARRLRVVQELLDRALDAASPGPVRLLSLCAGQARDVLGVVLGHPRRDNVRAPGRARVPAIGLPSVWP
jgi:hypothetical protein